jgi:hypothetical protein
MNPQQTISLKGDEKLAQKVNITFVDDIDGSEAIATIPFSYQGKDYELDLSQEHIEELEGALEKFIKHARRAGGSGRGKRGGGSASSASSNREETQKIRAWAIDQKLPINPRGRISQDIQDQFYAVHGKAS